MAQYGLPLTLCANLSSTFNKAVSPALKTHLYITKPSVTALWSGLQNRQGVD